MPSTGKNVAKNSATVQHKIIVENSVVDVTGQKEEKFFSAHLKRQEGVRNTFHRIVISTMYIIALSVVFIFIVRIWHMGVGTTSSLAWLSDQSLREIDKFLLSGAIGGLVSNYVSQSINSNYPKI